MMEQDEIITHLTETEARSKSNTKRLDRLTVETIHELAKNVAVLAESLASVKTDVQEIKTDVQGLKALPAKRWEQVVEKLIFGVVAAGLVALAGIVIAKIF